LLLNGTFEEVLAVLRGIMARRVKVALAEKVGKPMNGILTLLDLSWRISNMIPGKSFLAIGIHAQRIVED
jgi:hypothetical protein